MFFKLARKNVIRSVKDYTLYFLTLLFGVCVFYIFNSLETQWVMESLAAYGGPNKYLVDSILQLIDVVSVFVSFILAFLILYANTFMLRRRKRELGTYMLLGMEQGKIAALLFLETLFIGVLALGAGLALGVVLAQFLSAFTASLFEVTVEEFHFVFSWKGVFKTLLYFGVIFLVVMLFNSFSVARQRLIRLLQANRHNQSLKLRALPAAVVMFAASVILLATAYRMLLTRGLLQIDSGFWLMLALGTLGTLLFFRSLSGFLLQICQSSKKLYYSGMNMFILRQFNSNINTNYLSMTVVCLMLLLAIGITGCAVGMNNTIAGSVAKDSPFDISIKLYLDEPCETDFASLLTRKGFDAEKNLPQRVQINLLRINCKPVTVEYEGHPASFELFGAIAQSDFNTIMALQGKEGVDLAGDRYGVLSGSRDDPCAQLQVQQPPLVIDGISYQADPASFRDDMLYTCSSTYNTLVILPDAAAAGRKVDSILFVGNYPPGSDKETLDAAFHSVSFSHEDLVGEDYEGGYGYMIDSRLDIYWSQMGTKMLFLFIGLYLGIIFLVTSAAVLALQLLSQAADNCVRYQVLSRLGAEEKMRGRSVDIQVFLYFFLPLSLAVVHSIVGMRAANDVISQIGRLDAAASSTVTALFILLVYGAYFLATCWGSRRILRER
ncbi:ABC transporter permease [Pseudoflavonifractor sp. 524-17]|uniref:ABC transporter permease n=1 Tax=Pseudoflavonifractor sp. 524-17 TaxID=2304577 RepID=UPI0013799535|nr:FtsX-like permease family protein [Pseudoflavonifractor sp. 524-17]NCE63978.1 ABC transporter permease [Pseudoflavonifractor sp. 524-17]